MESTNDTREAAAGIPGAPVLALRIAYGVVPIVAGLDKFTNLLTDWTQYLSPLAARVLPVSPEAFMRVVGVVEVAVGVLVLSRLTRLGAAIASAWLAAIALNLVTSGRFLDVAARDAVMAVGAYALYRLAPVSAARPVKERSAPGALARPARAT